MFLRTEQLNASEQNKTRKLVSKTKKERAGSKDYSKNFPHQWGLKASMLMGSTTSVTINIIYSKEVIKEVRLELALKGCQRVTLT